MYVALNQGYVNEQEFKEIYEQTDKTARIVSGLITYLRTKATRSTRSTRQTRLQFRSNVSNGRAQLLKLQYCAPFTESRIIE